MSGSVIPSHITDRKRRGSFDEDIWPHHLSGLLSSWKKRPNITSLRVEDEVYPIKAVTYLEVFTRKLITQMVNHGSPYLENALPLGKSLKLDFTLLREVQGRTITLGDILGHSVSVNSPSQMISALETCVGRSVITFLSAPLERDPSPYQNPPNIFINDPSLILSRLNRLFEVRHILVHETPRKDFYSIEEVEGWLDAAFEFATVAEHHFAYLLHGTTPGTTGEIAAQAAETTKVLEEEMESVLHKLAPDEESGRMLYEAQAAWKNFFNHQCAYSADATRGGSMSRIIWAYEELHQTRLRLESLKTNLQSTDDQV